MSSIGLTMWLWATIAITILPVKAQEASLAPPVPALALTASPAAPMPPLPPVIARYEQMLAASPTKGTAFDKVYQHFFEGEGVDALDARWRARAAAGGSAGPAFLLLEGLLAERRAKPAEARTLYQQYTAAHPEDPRGWTVLGELETAEGRFGPSAAALAHALAPDAKPPVPVSARPTLYRELARAQTRDFLIAAALGTWRKLAAEFPDDPTVLQEVGEAFQEGESYDEARASFEKVRDLARQTGDAFGRINATLRLGQIEEARGHAKAAVGVYEGVVADAKAGSWLEREARARIEQLYRGQEDLPGLADYYQKWLDDHPKDVEVATRRAAVLVELNHKDQAIDLLKEAVAWAPERQELQVELARRLSEVNRPAEMAAVMEKLTTTAPEEKSYWQLLGDARWQLLDIGPTAATLPPEEKARLKTQALEAWGHLSPTGEKDAAATDQLADLLASHRLVDEALVQYSRAATLAPDLPDTHERRAVYLAQINRRDEARKVLAGIVSADPKNATAANYARLASGLDRLDDTDGALDANARGLALDPKNFDLLAQRWQELANAKKWADALVLYPALLAAAPNVYFTEQVQTRHVAALQSAGKLDETRKVLAARLDATPPATPLDENELSLLIRADLQAGGDGESGDEARRALADGRARFPRSAALVRLEAESAKRAHDTGAQVAALRRLLDLQPAQKTDVLQEIARVWRDADRLDEALATAHELVAASPANAASYLLEADLLLQGGHPDEGLGRLRQAVKLSEKPNEVRLRLARAQTDLGHDADARQTLDEAFESAADSHERLSMMKALADAYQRQNRLDELIARFQHLQQAEADGWRYALYLAEIYQQTLDYGAARRELAKALAARPKDGSLLRQLVRIANAEQNSAEVARYQAQLTEAEPSDSNRLALITALFENNQPKEGFNALRANLVAVMKMPAAWDQLLPLLAKNDLTTQAGELLIGETSGPAGADVKARFTLALFQAVAGKLEPAKTAFWSIFATKSPRASAPPPPDPAESEKFDVMSIYTGGSILEQRFREGSQTRYTVQQFLTTGAGGFRQIRYSSSGASGTGGSPQPNTPSALDTARDTSLLYLAAIAVKEHAVTPFLAELDRQLNARDSSREDRLAAYSLIESVDAELHEITAQVESPVPGLDPFCVSQIGQMGVMNNPIYRQYQNGKEALTAAQIAVMEPLLDRLLARTRRNAANGKPGDFDAFRYSFLVGIGRKETADAIRRKLLAETGDKSSTGQLTSALSLLLEGDLSAADRAQLKTVCRALVEDEAKAGAGTSKAGQFRQSYYYPVMVFQPTSGASKLTPVDFAEVEATLLTLWYPVTPPPAGGAALGTSNNQGFQSGNSVREDNFLPPTRFLDSNHTSILQQLWQMLGQGRNNEKVEALYAQLDRQAAELPESIRLYPRLISTYFAAYSGDNAKALTQARAILAEYPDDNDLRLFTGVLLGRNKQYAEAVTMLNGVTNARYGEAAMILQTQILLNAKAAQDKETARRAALRLVNLRLPPEDRTALIADLRELGVNDKADQMAKAAAPTRPGAGGRTHSIFDYETSSQIQTLVSAKNTDGALSLIRTVFSSLPPPATSRGNNSEYVIRQAVSSLTQLKKTDEFIAAAEKQLAKTPDSLSLNYQLAVLQQESGRSWTTEKRPSGSHRAPLWVKLARVGEEIAGLYSTDGEHWQEIARAKIDLGTAPLAALAAASSQTAPRAPDVVIDHVALTPLPTDGPDNSAAATGTEAALPAPWKEVLLPIDGGKTTKAPPSTWKDDTFTLHAAGWDLWGRYDDVRLVHQPLGAATEFVAHMVKVEGPDANTKAGVMWRADLTGDSAYAAVIVLPGGGLTFQHRDRINQATTYWRKVVALQPKDTRFGRALATHLAGRGLRGEAIPIYDGLIATDPDDAFASYDDMSNVYGDAHLPELADRLLAWKPGALGANSMRSYYSYCFYPVAKACSTAGQPEKTIALCRRGIELDEAMGGGGFTNVGVFELLLSTLLKEHRPDEARDVLVACYVPPDDGTGALAATGASSGPQLGFRNTSGSRAMGGSRWMWNVQWGNQNSISLYSLGPLEAANKAGLLEPLQTALEKRRDKDKDTFANDSLDWLLTLVQLDRRDPGVLEGLPALLNKAPDTTNNYGNNEQAQVAVRLEIARRLRQWSGHEALAVEAFRTAGKLAAGIARQYSPYNLMQSTAIQQAHTELELGDLPGATATLRELANGFINPTPGARSGNNSNDSSDLTRCLNLLLRAGPEADQVYLDLYANATKTDQGKKSYYFAYGLEKNQRMGDNPHYTALAWLLDDGADTTDATLVYELRSSHPYDKEERGKYPGSRGRSFTKSEGERTLTFSYGPDADHFSPIGQLKTSATFGTWTGPVPPGNGALKVTIDAPRAVDAAALAAEQAATPAPAKPRADYWLPVVRAPNLMTNPGFEGLSNRDPKSVTFSLPGWKNLPAGFWKLGTVNGPRPGRSYVECDLGLQEESILIGERIPVEPGRSYFQSGWLRDPGYGGSLHLGRHYLDANGQELKTSECAEYSTLIWRWHSQSLVSVSKDSDKEADLIPPGTAFVEPFVRVQGAVNWTGLFVSKLD